MKKSFLGQVLRNHALAMIICCAIPLTLLAIFSLTGSLGSWAYFALFLLCPILHILMMRGHMSSMTPMKEPIQSGDNPKGLLHSSRATKDAERFIESRR
jgi:hypothetical protein